MRLVSLLLLLGLVITSAEGGEFRKYSIRGTLVFASARDLPPGAILTVSTSHEYEDHGRSFAIDTAAIFDTSKVWTFTQSFETDLDRVRITAWVDSGAGGTWKRHFIGSKVVALSAMPPSIRLVLQPGSKW
jgi:hypothetical protein